MRTLLTIAAILLSSVASANSWHVDRHVDKMTDRTETAALVIAGDATLYVSCVNGQPQPRVRWDKRIGYGDLGVTYRFDAGEVVPRMAMLSQNGKDLWPWLGDPAGAIAKLRAGKRVRVQVTGGPVLDFDLGQGGQGLPDIRCR
jgi:hypothetical protein